MYIHNEKNYGGKEVEIAEFDTISEFYDYLCKTPFNDAFRWSRHASVDNNFSFRGTHTFEEAVDLMKNGWDDASRMMEKRLQAIKNEVQPTKKSKNIYDVQGFQCSVPRYLQGVPTNMVNKKNFPAKQKVITLNKSINYSCAVEKETIIEESVKAMQIVKKLEAQGYRVNVNIVAAAYTRGKRLITKVRIKSANERLNVSKVAFPLAHPSMLRRLMFRMREVHPTITKDWTHGYGAPMSEMEIKSVIPNEYLIPLFVHGSVNTIEDLGNIR